MLATTNKIGRNLIMNLLEAKELVTYQIDKINSDDQELNMFLLSLGCFQGSKITIIKRNNKMLTVSIKDGRYCIDSSLAEVIEIIKS